MRKIYSRLLLTASILLVSWLVSWPVAAAVQSKAVDYQDGQSKLQGYLFWDDRFSGKRPGILVVHEWWGLNDYAKGRARQLAELGYTAFALDMYGAGKVTRHPAQAKTWMKQINENKEIWVRRSKAGLAVLKQQPIVDTSHTAAIGYCFGGATVLEMAYAGLDLDAVVSFHGSLPVPTEDQMDKIKASILVAQGNDDPFVPAEKVAALRAALEKTEVDWELAVFGNTRHSFTNPGAADYGMDALAYNPRADKRSWAMMLELFAEKFQSSEAESR